ncbi:hypothetical protein HUK80_04330 [Flavobacterium sp. MAH-1]|uniref:Metal-dependent HD superfamily phosphohydrolase n=1 Tax=Flavobacterium agri TaxID=2743471 RepID=A0A7Y8Y0C5_9FLAO|nr:hypothetical protein [Flavobacterium agri]NUY80112.1 hypothetical protein [Flavobacterium agri]NYA70137.1 hypothetical protein [Flavobacterium agri]
MLRETFFVLTKPFCSEEKQTELWSEIEKSHSKKGRFYHDLSHLEHLLKTLSEIKSKISDWETTLFCLFYHDIVYKATGKTNEENSADLAAKRLSEIKYPIEKIEQCHAMILATKAHNFCSDSDINLFTDADLSILGSDWETYFTYAKNVRKEYKIYPDFMYNPGRKKVLQHFLGMPRMFKTDWFFERFEEQARSNLKRESDLL